MRKTSRTASSLVVISSGELYLNALCGFVVEILRKISIILDMTVINDSCQIDS